MTNWWEPDPEFQLPGLMVSGGIRMRVRHCCRDRVVQRSMYFEGPPGASLLLPRNLGACRTGTKRSDRLAGELVETFE